VRELHDADTLWLIDVFLHSFEKEKGKGLPLGNVTSQLFANIYLNELDQYVKHVLKATMYFRYCDDFIILHEDREVLVTMLESIKIFLHTRLALTVHPHKIELRKVSQGVDFLGYVIVPHARILRPKTAKRTLRKVNQKNAVSYFGIVSHCKARVIREKIRKLGTPSTK
jgi:hypothetical protein